MEEAPGSRRKFLKETLFGVAVLSVARFVPRSLLSAQTVPGSLSLRYFSEHEYLIIRAVADRIIGQAQPRTLRAQDIDLALRADQFLATADPEIQEQFHLLLTVFNARLFTFLFDFRFSSFVDMHRDDQDSYLADWMTSRLGFRRAGFQGLKRLCISMFYTDNRTWDEIGYRPVFLPEEQK